MELPAIPQKSILQLNDECLIEIFSYFPVRELIVLDKVCGHFRYIAEEYFYKKQTVMEINGCNVTRKAMEEMAERLGGHVSTLIISADIPIVNLHPIWSQCTKIEHLILRHVSIRDKFDYLMSMVRDVFKGLKSLELANCRLTGEIGFEAIDQLEVLSLRDNPDIDGNFLPSLKNQLKEIDLTGCSRILLSPPYFEAFCKDNLKLEKLTLNRLKHSTDLTECLEIIDNLKNLQCLKIGDCIRKSEGSSRELERMEIGQIIVVFNDFGRGNFARNQPDVVVAPDLPNLKHLEIKSNYLPNYSGMLDRLAEQNNLETLGIDGKLTGLDGILPKFTKIKILKFPNWNFEDTHLAWISGECRASLERLHLTWTCVTDAGVIQFIQDCPGIKFIDLRRCQNITKNVILDLVPILNERPHTVEICIARSSISESLEELQQQLVLRGNQKIKLK